MFTYCKIHGKTYDLKKVTDGMSESLAQAPFSKERRKEKQTANEAASRKRSAESAVSEDSHNKQDTEDNRLQNKPRKANLQEPSKSKSSARKFFALFTSDSETASDVDSVDDE